MGKLRTALLAGMVVALGAMGSANAAPITGTFNISIYQGDGGGNINNPEEQAQQGNPLITAGNLIASGTYTGAIDFNDGGQNDIGAFLNSGGGVLSAGLSGLGGTTLSASGFGLTSVFVITGDVGANILFGSISHDDGASLYDGPGYSNLVAGSPAPTVDIDTLYSNLTGQFQLIYVEANSIPAVLTMDVTRTVTTPEPLSLSLFGAGLAGLGALRRRRRKAA